MPLYVFPKMSSHTLRLSKSAESYASNADFTSYSAIAVVGPKSKLPSSQVATPAIFAHKRTRAMFPSLVAESPPADCRGHARSRCFSRPIRSTERSVADGVDGEVGTPALLLWASEFVLSS